MKQKINEKKRNYFLSSRHKVFILICNLFSILIAQDCQEGMIYVEGDYLGGEENLCVPEDFSSANQSTLQGFYSFWVITINGVEVNETDWVGAFKGDVCVGARQWDTSQCNGGVCDIVVMGDDGFESTSGYMISGEIPTFRIYDFSTGQYYEASPSGTSTNMGWVINGIKLIDSLEAVVSILGCINSDACNYDSAATIDDDSCKYTDDICETCEDGIIIDNDADDDSVCDANETLGCTDAEACNYNPDVTNDDASCEYAQADHDCDVNLSINGLAQPNTFSISNIYPNPFNPITSIGYSLTENATIEILVYNIHGRQIQTLVKGFQIAGSHSISWNASNYPSGVYLIKLGGDRYSIIQKVVLIK